MINNLIVNPEADIFIFNNGEIKIILENSIIEIDDSENGDIKHLFLGIQNYNLKKYKTIEPRVNEALNELVRLKVLQYRSNECMNEDMRIHSVLPYVLHNLKDNLWYMRRGMQLLYFMESDTESANRLACRLRLSWIDEIESGIVSGIINNSIECLPLKHAMPKYSELSLVKLGEILIFDCKNGKITKKNLIYNSPANDFWLDLSDRASGIVGIVPLVHGFKMSVGNKLSSSRYIHLSCHKFFDLSDSSDSEWQVGIDKVEHIAKGKAIMESIERFCGKQSSFNHELISTAKELGEGRYIHPDSLAKYSVLQRGYGWVNNLSVFREDIPYHWIELTEINSGDKRYIPIDFVSYASDIGVKNARLFVTSSSGMAAHIDKLEAIKRATLEVIERDSIMIHWLNRISPSKITINNQMPPRVKVLQHDLRGFGMSLTIIRMTIDTVPVVAAIIHGEYGGLPIFLCGASAEEAYVAAIEKAIDEVEFAFFSRLSDMDNLRKRINAVETESICTPLDHEALYMKKNMSQHIGFLLKNRNHLSLSDIEFENCSVEESLKRKNMSRYVIDMTHEEVNNLNLGISVVRIIIPGLVPITFGYGQEPLAMDRVINLPFQMGLINDEIKESDLVDIYLPHFFA